MDDRVAQLLRAALDPERQHEAARGLKEIQDAQDRETQRQFVLALLRPHTDPGVRQMAAVTLRRHLETVWTEYLTPEDKTGLWEQAVQMFSTEVDFASRRALAHLVGAASKLRYLDGCEGLVEFVIERFPAADVGLMVLAEIAATERATPTHVQRIVVCFRTALAAPETETVIAAIKGALKVVEERPRTDNFVEQILPALLTRIKQSANDDDIVSPAVELLSTMATELPTQFTEEVAHEVIPVAIEAVGLNESLPMGVREQAFQLMHDLSFRMPKGFCRKPHIFQGLLRGVFQMACQPEPEHVEDGELTPFLVACNTIDSLALNLCPQTFLQHVLDLLDPLIRSANVWERRAALTFLGLISEGCSEWLRGRVSGLVEYPLAALAAPEPLIRQAGGLALGQMAEYLQPEILRFAPQAFQAGCQALAASLDENNEEVVCKLCYALEVFCSHVTGRYQAQLFPLLMRALTRAVKEPTKAAVLEAIAALADSETFAPHRRVAAELVQSIFRDKDRGDGLKCSAIKLASKIVAAMPTDQDGLRDALVKLVLNELNGIDADDTVAAANECSSSSSLSGIDTEVSIRSVCFQFFERYAHAARDQMAPILVPVMSAAVAAAFSSDAVCEGEDDCVQVHTGTLDQLTCAIDCMTAVFISLSPELTLAYGSKALEIIALLHNHYHNYARVSVSRLAAALLFATHATARPPWWPAASDPTYDEAWRPSVRRPWTPGFPTQCLLSAPVKTLWFEHVWPCLATVLVNDSDHGVVSDLSNLVAEIIAILGPGALADAPSGDLNETYASLIVNCVEAVLDTTHPCLADCDVSLDDGRLRDEEVFEGVSALLGALAEVLGGSLAVPVFERFQPRLLRLVNDSASAVLRCNGLGCYADMLRTLSEMPDASRELLAKYVAAVAPTLAEGISQRKSIVLRQNSSFVAGIVAQVAPHDPATHAVVGPCFQAAQQALQEYVLETPLRGETAAMDNLVAMVARFLLHLPSGLVPKEQLAHTLLTHLPLREDFAESVVCAQAFIQLVREGDPNNNFLQMGECGALLCTDSKTVAILTKAQGMVDPQRSLLQELEEAVRVVLANVDLNKLKTSPKLTQTARTWIE